MNSILRKKGVCLVIHIIEHKKLKSVFPVPVIQSIRSLTHEDTTNVCRKQHDD
jgi:hypothetical protein